MLIRNIEASDNAIVSQLIRDVLTEFGANRPGFAWQDPELDAMSHAYEMPDRVYKVIDLEGKVVGAGGIGPFLNNQYDHCCELQKMYLDAGQRGKGFGRSLIETLLQSARELGYEYCYLESLSAMQQAIALYELQGFKRLEGPLGDSGHNACDEWMLLKL